jgi:hypothetical protein
MEGPQRPFTSSMAEFEKEMRLMIRMLENGEKQGRGARVGYEARLRLGTCSWLFVTRDSGGKDNPLESRIRAKH